MKTKDCSVVHKLKERGMGCMWSAEEFKEGDDSLPSASAQTKLLLVDNADAYVFIPGFRTPKPTDLAVALQRFNIPSALLNRLVSLRSGVIQAVGGEEEAVSGKSKKRKSHQGAVDSSSLEKALRDYLPVLLGLTFTGLPLQILVHLFVYCISASQAMFFSCHRTHFGFFTC